jgi:tRNA (guanine37-N1)-methyltransferase
MRIDVLTLFPGIFDSFLSESIISRAIEQELVQVALTDIRTFSNDKHNKVDDRPFGGGPGMVIRPQPVVEAAEAVLQQEDDAAGERANRPRVILLTPAGRRFDQRLAAELATERRIVLVCGRYEGIDHRAGTLLGAEEVSLGDFVLNGGEVAAMAMIEAVTRLLPGVLGDDESSTDESFSTADAGLEYPQYTRPREYRGQTVPEILLSGDHSKIAAWRREQARLRTRENRPDLM